MIHTLTLHELHFYSFVFVIVNYVLTVVLSVVVKGDI